MPRKILTSLILAAIALPSAAMAGEREIGQETTINDAGNGGIRGFDIVARDTVFVRDRRNNWYKVALTSPCFQSIVPQEVAFDTDRTGRLDRMSKVRTRDHSCGIASITTAAPPPSEKSRTD